MTRQKSFIYEFRTRRVRRAITVEVPSVRLESPSSVADLVRQFTKGDARENFFVFFLDAKNSLVGFEVVAIGTLAEVAVHPREVFRSAIVAPASAIVLAHNHPSNSCEPSDEDRALTRRLVSAGEVLGIPVLDHVVVSEDDHTSLSQNGFIQGIT